MSDCVFRAHPHTAIQLTDDELDGLWRYFLSDHAPGRHDGLDSAVEKLKEAVFVKERRAEEIQRELAKRPAA